MSSSDWTSDFTRDRGGGGCCCVAAHDFLFVIYWVFLFVCFIFLTADNIETNYL